MDLGFGDDPAFSSAKVTISLAQQQKYLAEKSAEEIALAIERANEYSADQEMKGNQVNFGALYQTAIMQGWGQEHKAKLEVEAKRIEKKSKTERAKEVEKERDFQAEQDRTLLRKDAKERFSSLDPTEQSNLISEFGNTLKGFPLTTFKKTGVSSAMLAPTFANWLVDRFQIATA